MRLQHDKATGDDDKTKTRRQKTERKEGTEEMSWKKRRKDARSVAKQTAKTQGAQRERGMNEEEKTPQSPLCRQKRRRRLAPTTALKKARHSYLSVYILRGKDVSIGSLEWLTGLVCSHDEWKKYLIQLPGFPWQSNRAVVIFLEKKSIPIHRGRLTSSQTKPSGRRITRNEEPLLSIQMYVWAYR